MTRRILRTTVVLVMLLSSASVFAQGFAGRNRNAAPLPTGKAGAPEDLTGYWVSIVTTDWQYRMIPPVKITAGPRVVESIVGVTGIPMNEAAQKVALAWDPAKDEADGDQCKAYGAGNIMRIPGRIHISWQDEDTLKLETDAGMQTRLFEFKAPKQQGGDWQGISKAAWENVPGATGVLLTGSLQVITTHFKPGYLDKNGIPYSENAVVSEFFDRVDEGSGTYLVVTRTVQDPTYLYQPYLTSVQFKKEDDGSHWNPSPCAVR
jgi:hypothetical protein